VKKESRKKEKYECVTKFEHKDTHIWNRIEIINIKIMPQDEKLEYYAKHERYMQYIYSLINTNMSKWKNF